MLGAHGHRLVEAVDGRAALAAARAEPPDLVITDVLMPVMDGYELVKQLRLDPATQAIPVVFYTAHYGEDEARALARSSGVAWVLTKPSASEKVAEIVDRVLNGTSDTGLAAAALTIPTAFDRQHLRLLTNKLSDTVDDVRLANDRLRSVINIALELSSERDAPRLLERVCEAARDLFKATYVTLGIIDLRDRRVQQFVTCGTTAVHCFKPGDSISGLLETIVAEQRTVRGSNPGDPAALQLPPLHPHVKAFLAAPVLSPTCVYGWICLVENEGLTFTEDDEQLVTALSGLVGRIYESAHFVRLAQQRSIALEHEIGERRLAESAFRQERDRAQEYLDTAEVILLALDLDARITLVNRKGRDVLGWEDDELLGRDWVETCIPARERDALQCRLRNIRAGDLAVVENLVMTRTGEERLIEWCNTLRCDDAGRVVGTFSSGSDVTERRALEAQYQQAQKMEAVGQLASGVAHDFNNMLTVILGYCELLLADVDENARRQADITEIQLAGKRAETLTRQLLAFSRKQVIEPTLQDLNVIVAEMRPMLGRLIREDVQVVFHLQLDVSAITVDRGQMEQVIVNLAVNARDAMPKGGTLTIETANIELEERDCQISRAIPGPHVMLKVSDTGTGMTPHVQARLFEPFFTTKGPGRGTGIGLATVQGIVMRSGATMAVDSEVGRGTSFTVYFPRAQAAGRTFAARPPMARTKAGAETVLVVDDEGALRELTRRLLNVRGYNVLTAANAEEALALCEHAPPIDVLLTDVVMPGASGPELKGQLVQRRPDLKVIYMSGYTDDALVRHGILNPGIAFLNKPFSAQTQNPRHPRPARRVIDVESRHDAVDAVAGCGTGYRRYGAPGAPFDFERVRQQPPSDRRRDRHAVSADQSARVSVHRRQGRRRQRPIVAARDGQPQRARQHWYHAQHLPARRSRSGERQPRSCPGPAVISAQARPRRGRFLVRAGRPKPEDWPLS
jgi:PAS domain S-box-containing protein